MPLSEVEWHIIFLHSLLYRHRFTQSAVLYIQIGCLLSSINIYDEKLS